MNSKTKKIIVSIIILLVFIFLIKILTKSDTDQISNKTPTNTPTAQNVQNLPIKIEQKPEFNLAESLPIVTFNYKNTDLDSAKAIAKNIGFSENPNIISDGRVGTKYLWNNENHYLWVTPTNSHISYGITNPKTSSRIGSVLKDEQIYNFAYEFFAKLNLTKDKIIPTQIHYLRGSDNPEAGFIIGVKENAKLIQVNFTYKDIGYPVFTNTPNSEVLFVLMQTDGNILSAQAYLLDNISKPTDSLKLKNFDQVKNSLSQATLIGVENDYLNTSDIKKEDVKNIDIDKLTLGYKLDDLSQSKILTPTFLLSGKISIKDTTATYAHLYMPAVQ